MAATISVSWIPTDTLINMCWGRSATKKYRCAKSKAHKYRYHNYF